MHFVEQACDLGSRSRSRSLSVCFCLRAFLFRRHTQRSFFVQEIFLGRLRSYPTDQDVQTVPALLLVDRQNRGRKVSKVPRVRKVPQALMVKTVHKGHRARLDQ